MGSEIADIQTGLAKLRRVSKWIRAITIAVALILSVAVLASFAICLQPFFQADVNYSTEFILAIASSIFSLVLGVSVLIALAMFFNGIAKGGSPFEQKAVRLVRVMSLFFLVYALCDLFFPSLYFLVDSGADVLFRLVGQGYPLFRLNLTALFSAIVFLSLSFAFSYGSKLQQLSDDTV